MHLTLSFPTPPRGPVAIGFDTVPGGAAGLPGSALPDGTDDAAVVLDPDGPGPRPARLRPAARFPAGPRWTGGSGWS